MKAKAVARKPKFNTDCPVLPFENVNNLQLAHSSVANLPETATLFRATIEVSDGEEFGRSFDLPRKEYLKAQANQICQRGCLGQVSAIGQPTKPSFHDTPAHQLQLEDFCCRVGVRFLYLLFDSKMSLLGTVDHLVGRPFPGLSVCPDFINRRPTGAKALNLRGVVRGNLMEVSLQDIPKNVFAVLPVVIDEIPRHTQLGRPADICDDERFEVIELKYSTFVQTPSDRLSELFCFENGAAASEDSLPEDYIKHSADGTLQLYLTELNHRAEQGTHSEASESLKVQWNIFKHRKRPTPAAVSEIIDLTHVRWLTSSSEQNEAVDDNSCCKTLFIEEDLKARRSAENVVNSSSKMWVKLVEAAVSRSFRTKEISTGSKRFARHRSNTDVRQDQLRNKPGFGVGDAFLPFALFRRHSPESGWSFLPLQERISECNRSIETIVRSASKLLCDRNILPLHVIHVEHCVNCELHQLTTRHVPGSYLSEFRKLKAHLKRNLPPCLVYNNLRNVSPSPQVGSFEISLQAYGEKSTLKIYSKMSKKVFPDQESIAAELLRLLTTPVVEYAEEVRPGLEVRVVCGYSDRPLVGARILVRRIHISAKLSESLEEEDFKTLDTEQSSNFCSSAPEIGKSPMKSGLDSPKPEPTLPVIKFGSLASTSNASKAVRTLHGPMRTDSPTKLNSRKDLSATRMMTSSSLPALSPKVIPATLEESLRKTTAFTRCRAWGKSDVVRWLRSFGVSDEVVKNAVNDGMEDGPSMLLRLSDSHLMKWGVANRLDRLKVMRGFNEIVASDGKGPLILEPYTLGTVKPPSIPPIEEQESPSVLFEDVSAGVTNRNGVWRSNIQVSGSYYVEISHPGSEDFHSHCFSIETTSNNEVLAKLRPKLALVMVVVSFECSHLTFVETGLLVSLVNMKSGKKHVIHVKSWKETVNGRPCFVGAKWLPVGKYFSCVTGELFDVNSAPSDCSYWRGNLPEYFDSSPLDKAVLTYSSRQAIRCHDITMFQAIRGLQKLYKRLRRARLRFRLQAILSVKKQFRRMIGRTRAKIALRKYIRIQTVWRRASLQRWYRAAKCAVLVIQCVVRGFLVRAQAARQQRAKGVFFFLQALENASSGKRTNERRRGEMMMGHAAMLKALRVKRLESTIKIQSIVRMYMARKLKNALRRERKSNEIISRYVPVFMAKARKLIFRRKERHREFVESTLMYQEEKLIRHILRAEVDAAQRQRDQEKRRLADKLKHMELKARAAQLALERQATLIQKIWRGILCRIRLNSRAKAAKRIQVLIRQRIATRKRILAEKVIQEMKRRKFENSPMGSALKAVRKLSALPIFRPLFRSASAQPLKSASRRKSVAPRKPSIFTFPFGATADDKFFRELLDKRAVKIQSIVRMRRMRKKYLAKRAVLRLDNRLPAVQEGNERENLAFDISQGAGDEAGDTIGELPISPLGKLSKDIRSASEQIGRRLSVGVVQVHRHSESAIRGIREFIVARRRTLEEQALKRELERLKLRRERAVVRLQAAFRGWQCRRVNYQKEELFEALTKTLLKKCEEQKSDDDENASQPGAEETKNKKHSDGLSEIKPRLSSSLQIEVPHKEETVESSVLVPSPDREGMRLRPQLSIITTPTWKGETAASDLKNIVNKEEQTIPQKLPVEAPTPKSASKSTGPKTPMSVSGAMIETFRSAGKLSGEVGAKLVDTANRAQVATKEYLLRQKLAKERENNRKLGNVSICDALVNIRGTLMTDIPTLEHKWFLAVYPKASYAYKGNEEFDLVSDTWREHRGEAGKESTVLTEENHSTNPEKTQTMSMYPFSLESISDMSFFVHLSDLSRYKSLEVCVFIENHEAALLPTSTAEEGVSRSNIDGIPTVSSERNARRSYIPAFSGECSIGRGASFGPCGGRMHMVLKPNSFEVMHLPHGRRLLATQGLNFLVTLIPVVQPSSRLLRTFRSMYREAPCYPSHLLDSELITNINVQWDLFNGGAVTAACYRDRVLVSTRNKGDPVGVCEYNASGEYVGKVFKSNRRLGNVVLMISGFEHVACCGSTGAIMILRQEPLAKGIIPGTLPQKWDLPLMIPSGHKDSIVAGCVLAHAGLDFFFTVDRLDLVCVTIMDKGNCLRSFSNAPFLNAPIKKLCAYDNFLYIGLQDGVVAVVNLQPIMTGDIENAGRLHRYVLSQESLFLGSASICSMAVVAPNGFLGIRDEDECKREEERKFQRKEILGIDVSARYEVVEGHLLLLGGGDEDPCVRILQPHIGGMREVVSLRGHVQAVTQLAVDAAGRCIITASSGEKRILIWDGLSFTCERQIEGVSIGGLCLGENCLLVTSIKTPFLRMWKAEDLKPQTQAYYRNRRTKYREMEMECQAESTDITLTRSPQWCQSMLKGGFKPSKATLKPAFVSDDYIQVLWRWTHQYERPDFVRLENPLSSKSKLRFLQSPSDARTPMTQRKLETPRARARRQFEKTQFQLALAAAKGDNSSEAGSGSDSEALASLEAAGAFDSPETHKLSFTGPKRSPYLSPLEENAVADFDDYSFLGNRGKTSTTAAADAETASSSDDEAARRRKLSPLPRKYHFSDNSDSDGLDCDEKEDESRTDPKLKNQTVQNLDSKLSKLVVARKGPVGKTRKSTLRKKLAVEERVEKARLMKEREEIAARQQKLRPRLLIHFDDADSD